MKLMIIDDHAGVRHLIRHLLAKPGDAVCECASGSDAVCLAPAFKPDYVTVDIAMPGLNGFEATRAIRAIHPAARVVIVSAFDQVEFHAAATRAGAINYVKKDNLTQLRSVLLAGPEPVAQSSPTATPGAEQSNGSIETK